MNSKHFDHNDPRFRDPSPFPCAIDGCADHASGWVRRELAPTLGVRVADGALFVFLCEAHLDPLRRGEL